MRTGFISRVKSKGRYYYYIRRSYRKKDTVYKESIMSLGTKENAIRKVIAWINDTETIPRELEGFTKEDFQKWYDYIKK
jgi:hypothetical protein